MSTLQTGEWAAVATALLWTMSTLAWTIAGRRVGSLPVSFLRLVLACGLLSAYGWAMRGQPWPSDADARTWWLLGVSGFMGFFVCDACLFEALVLIGPRLTLLLQSLVPPVTIILSWIFLAEALTVSQIVAMVITVAGVVWVILERRTLESGKSQTHHHAWGVTLAVLAAGAAAVSTVLGREGIGQYDAAAATYIRILGALPGYVVLLTLVSYWKRVGRTLVQARTMMIMCFGCFVGPFLGVILYMVALRHCPAGVVATILSTMPVLVLPFSILIFKEKISWRAAGGAALAVFGVMLMCQQS